MRLKALSTAVAALSLVVAPTVSAATPVVTPLTQQNVAPAAETVAGDNALFGGGAGFFVLVLAIGAITLGILAATKGNSRPNSP